MALIPCPECQRLISEKAHTCPKCGFPYDEYRYKKNIRENVGRNRKNITLDRNVTSIFDTEDIK